MASTEIFTMKTYFNIENPKQPKAGTLQINLKHRHRKYQQPQNDVGTFQVSFPVVTSDCFAMAPHVLAIPKFRRRCILKALASVDIVEPFSQCLKQRIDKFTVEKTQAFGIMGFAVVANIEVTEIEGLAGQKE